MLIGVAAHAALAGLEAVIPGIGGHRLDPLLRLIPAALAAILATRGPGAGPVRNLTRATLAGALASLLGISLSLVLGQPGSQILPPLVAVTGSGVLVGLGWGAFTAMGTARSG